MDTLTDKDRKLLEFISARQIVKQSELLKTTGTVTSDGVAGVMRTLIDGGYVSIIRPLGETAFTITQKGIRAVGKGS